MRRHLLVVSEKKIKMLNTDFVTAQSFISVATITLVCTRVFRAVGP